MQLFFSRRFVKSFLFENVTLFLSHFFPFVILFYLSVSPAQFPTLSVAASRHPYHPRRCLTALEQQDGHLAQIEVDEVPSLVRHVGSEISAHYTMPGRVVLLVKLLLDVRGNVLFYIVFF